MAALFEPYQPLHRLLAIGAAAVVVILAATLGLTVVFYQPTQGQRDHAQQVEGFTRTLAAFANTFAAEQALADYSAAQRQSLMNTAAATIHQQISAGADTITLLRFAAQSLRLEAIYLLDNKNRTVALWGAQSQPELFREAPEVANRLKEKSTEPWARKVQFQTKAGQPFCVTLWPRPQNQGFIVMVQTQESVQQVTDWSPLYTKFLEHFIDGTPGAAYAALLEPNDHLSYFVARDTAEVTEITRLRREHRPFKELAAKGMQTTERVSSRSERILEVCLPYHAASDSPGSVTPARGIIIAGFHLQGPRPMPNLRVPLIACVLGSISLIGLLHFMNRRVARRTAQRLQGDTQNILETFSSGVLAINSDTVVVAINRRTEEITGLRRDHLIGLPYQRGFENEKELNYVLLDTLHNGRLYENHEINFRKPDDTTIPLRVSTARLQLSGVKQPGAMALIEDVSEQHRLEARMRRNERLSAMGQLAHGVAHEIRNPLNAIEMTAQHVQSQFMPENAIEREKFQRFLRAIREEVRRLDQIVRRFLELARPPETSLSEVDLNGLVEHVLTVQAEQFHRHNIEAVRALAANIPRIHADKGQLQQALMNLVVNAIHALTALPKDATREIKITTAFVPAQAPDEADGVEITVADTGVGIRPEHREKIFDPYFTTKQGGSGLGLAIVHSITLNHGGIIEVESAPGAGTIFRWLLPVEFGETL